MKYWLYKTLFALVARLPWWLIGLLSRGVAWCLYHVVRYRRSTVEDNLRLCLPERSAEELQRTARDFYEHLAHQFLASPKMLASSPTTICQQYIQLEGVEELAHTTLGQGKRIAIILMGHCGNWEVFSAANIYFRQQGMWLEQLYRPLRDSALDAVQRQMRMRHGSITTPKGEAGKRIIHLMRSPEAEPVAMAFIADQKPRPRTEGLWIEFLGRTTPFLDGAERLARKYDLPVYYCDIERITNRHYRGHLVCIAEGGGATPPGYITQQFAHLLEQTIRRDPAIWLWSHKRWKHATPSTAQADA